MLAFCLLVCLFYKENEREREKACGMGVIGRSWERANHDQNIL